MTDNLAAGVPQELIVEFDDTAINHEIATQRAKTGLARDDAAILALRSTRSKSLERGNAASGRV